MGTEIGFIMRARMSARLALALAALNALDAEAMPVDSIEPIELRLPDIDQPATLAKKQIYKPWGKKHRRYNK